MSLAEVARPGAFSVFERTRRHSVVVAGDRLHLASTHSAVQLAPHALATYAGGTPWDCRLEGGPASVLNVMCEEDRASADVLLVQEAWLAPREAATLVVLPVNCAATVAVAERPGRLVGPGRFLSCSGAESLACSVSDRRPGQPSYLAVIRVGPHHPRLC